MTSAAIGKKKMMIDQPDQSRPVGFGSGIIGIYEGFITIKGVQSLALLDDSMAAPQVATVQSVVTVA